MTLAANYQWTQSDWTGGSTTAATGHDPAQNGQTLWNSYSSKDANADTLSTPGQISLSPVSGSWFQGTDTDFNSGTLTNMQVTGAGNAAFLKLRDYTLDLGTGADGDLVVDGTLAGNSTDGQVHGAANPFIIDVTKNYANVRVQSSGVISTTPAAPLPSPAGLTITQLSGVNGPDGTFYYVLTAVDSFGLETARSPSTDGTSNRIIISGNNAPQISWNPVTGAAGYRVYRTSTLNSYSSPSFIYDATICSTTTAATCVDTLITPLPGAPHLNSRPAISITTSCTGGSLANGTYYYAATAIDFLGFETTLGTQISAAISCGTNTASATLTLSPVTGASGYRVYRTTQTGIYNNPALVCETTSTNCTNTSMALLPRAPLRNYDNATANGGFRLKISGALSVDGTSAINLAGRGFAGGIETQLTVAIQTGVAGKGPGAAANSGGGGGYGTAGTQNNNPGSCPSNVGNPYGDATLLSPYPGSGGASGNSTTTSISGSGGNGGGGIRISADSISLLGTISARGNPGGNAIYNRADPGGGGSGGSIFIDGNSLSNNGQMVATGGAGGIFITGAFRTQQCATTGGSGGDGRVRISTPSPAAGTGTTTPLPMIGDIGNYVSLSKDLGAGGVLFKTISWTASLPASSTLGFQIATNKDNQTWNFIGPDGTSNTYYTVSGSPISPVHSGDRYVRYKAFFTRSTILAQDSPTLDSVTIAYESNPSLQSLISSPYDTTDVTNTIRRWSWDENLATGTDAVLQLRTSQNGSSWGSWYGPQNTTFAASSGVSTITVADVTGLSTGSWVTLANSANIAQEEVKKITTVNTGLKQITLDSATAYPYASGSTFTDVYTSPSGIETINPLHRDGSGDRWLQYRVFLMTQNGNQTPVFYESRIGYLPAGGLYQPDGVINGNGDGAYGAFGSGGGGTSTQSVDPGFKGGQGLYNVQVQNDGTQASGMDTYTITWNSPSDVSGPWTVVLNDGISDRSSPVTLNINPGTSQNYTLKVSPSAYAPPSPSQTIILDIRSENEYSKVDSIRAITTVNPIYQADGVLDGDGDNRYDTTGNGGGGTSSTSGLPGNTVTFSLLLENEGNIADAFTLSQTAVCGGNPGLLPDWRVLVADDQGIDRDITLQSWDTPSVPAKVNTGSTPNLPYSLKVKIPNGAPTTCDIFLKIVSKGTGATLDSLKATVNIGTAYKVDLWIEGGQGDNVYGGLGTGAGGGYNKGISGGTTGTFVISVQNEGNVPDYYQLSWTPPAGWATAILHQDGSMICTASPCIIPPSDMACIYKSGSQCLAIPGEVIPLKLQITPIGSFTSGTQSIIVDGASMGDPTKVDSVLAKVSANALNITISSVTSTSATITWTAPAWTANSYDLRYSRKGIIEDGLVPGLNQINFSNAAAVRGLSKPKSAGSPESFTVSQLYANTSYYFALKTRQDASYTSVNSQCTNCPAVTSSSSDAAPPSRVTDLQVTTSTTDSLTLCWTAPFDDNSSTPVTGYILRYSTKNIVDDGGAAGMGEVLFSNAATSDNIGIPKSPGDQECYKVKVQNNVSGNDRTPNTQFFVALKSEDENHNLSPLSNVVQGLTAMSSNVYGMVSVPKVPNPNTPAAVFGDDISPSTLYLYGWDSRGVGQDQGCYDGLPSPYNPNNISPSCTTISTIQPGNAYFLWSPRLDISLDVPSGSTDVPATTCTDEFGQNFTCIIFPLQVGWNMIGNPFVKEVDVNAIKVRETKQQGPDTIITTVPFLEAATVRNWIGNAIYTYNGTNYTYESCDATICSSVLQPWKGYWIWLLAQEGGGGNATYDLLIPRP